MRRIISGTIALLLSFGGVSAGSLPAQAAAKFSSCVSLNKKFPTGVAATSRAAERLSSANARPKVDRAVFNRNRSLDRDRDLVICPVKARVQGDPYARAFGTFTAMSFTGVGDDVIELPVGLKAGFVELSHVGGSNFAVWSFDKDMERVDLLANEIGNYSGSSPFGFGFSDDPVKYLEVTAGGTWTINIKPITDAPAFTGEGSGSGVFKGTVKVGSKTLTHDGSSNFAVWQYCTNGHRDLLVNEIGSYTGRKIVKAGSCVIAVEADGTWSIK